MHRLLTVAVYCVTGASSGLGEATALRLAREPDARLVLVARRAERLEALAKRCGNDATWVAVDLTDEHAPDTVRTHLVDVHGGRLDVLVNNAGVGGRGTVAEGGWETVRRTMALNFDAQVRLTVAVLDLLRASAPSAIVNVSSTAGRVARAGGGAYSASKFALAGWSDALAAEEAAHGVHVGLVLPGFVPTEGFPAHELRASRLTRLVLGRPEQVAEAVADCALKGRAERYVPRGYWVAAAARLLLPGVVRRVTASGAAGRLTTATRSDPG